MNVREFKEKLRLPESAFTDSEIQILIDNGSHTVDFYLPTLKDCVILYEASRLIGDTDNIKYYKNKLLGKLGLVY